MIALVSMNSWDKSLHIVNETVFQLDNVGQLRHVSVLHSIQDIHLHINLMYFLLCYIRILVYLFT